MVLELIGGAMVLAGSVFCLIGVLGLLRFPDVYTRLHAAGIGDTLGAGLIIGGLVLVSLPPAFDHGFHVAPLLVTFKLVAILFFMWVSGTTACHALAKAAHMSGVEPWSPDGSVGAPIAGGEAVEASAAGGVSSTP